MKVPVYRSSAKLPQRTGAAQLTVQANPQALSKAGRAEAAFGQTLVGGAIDIWGAWLKTERAGEQLTEENKFAKTIRDAHEEVYKTGPGAWQDKSKSRIDQNGNLAYGHLTSTQRSNQIRGQLNTASSTQAADISDRVVRRRVLQSNQESIEVGMTQISAALRGHYTKWAQNQIKATRLRWVEELSAMAPGEQKNAAMKRAKESLAYFTTLVPTLGDLTRGNAARDLEKDVASYAIRKAITPLTTAKQVLEWYNRIGNPPENDPYRSEILAIGENGRQKFQEQLFATHATMQRKEIAEAIAAPGRNAAAHKLKQKKKFEEISASLLVSRDKNETPIWNAAKINGLARAVSDTQRKTLLNIYQGTDAIYNPKADRDISYQILEAVTEDDLDVIQRGIDADLSSGIIGGKLAQELQGEIFNARKKTPGYLEFQMYHKAIKSALGKSGMTVVLGGKRMNQDREAQRQIDVTEAQNFYQNEVKQNGVRPAVAYYNTIERVASDKSSFAASIVKMLPDQFKDAFSPTVLKNIAYMDEDTIAELETRFGLMLKNTVLAGKPPLPVPELAEKTQEELGQLQRFDTDDRGLRLSKKDRLTIRALLKVEAQIDFLKAYVNDPNSKLLTDDGTDLGNKIKSVPAGSDQKAKEDALMDQIWELLKIKLNIGSGKAKDRSGE